MTEDWERAAKAGDTASIEAQIVAGADVNALDRYGQSALMLASMHGHLGVIRVLLREGAALDVTAKYGLSATMLAVINHHEPIARAPAEAGADLRLAGSGAPGFAGRTAADLARERGEEALARALSPPSARTELQ